MNQQRLEDLAEGLTRHLAIPFRSTEVGTISFRTRLRISDWVVPLLFEGHVAQEGTGLVPLDFVGYALWPALTSTGGNGERPWWQCHLTPHAAEAILDHKGAFDELPDEDNEGWLIGRDVLLERAPSNGTRPARRPRVA